jgi:ribosomal-protein-alanine N-acetyltransferase
LDPTGIYVGELNGKPIATHSTIKYPDGYRHLGSYIVEKGNRHLGFGVILTKACIDNSAPYTNLSLYTTPGIARKVEKPLGMNFRWRVGIYYLDIPKSLKTLREYNSNDCEVKNLNEVDMQDIYNYDTDVFGYNREKFLEKWFNTPGTHTRVAVNKEGSIVGYVAARLAFIRDEGYKIAPLFCENIEVGKALLKGVLEDVHEHGLSSSNSAILDCPVGRNLAAEKLMQLLNGRSLGHIEFMITNGLPKGRFDQWFAITSPVCG